MFGFGYLSVNEISLAQSDLIKPRPVYFQPLKERVADRKTNFRIKKKEYLNKNCPKITWPQQKSYSVVP